MVKKKASKTKHDKTDALPKPPLWLLLTYEPVSLFSLRSTYSMSKGGKTLLIPTPYAVKMALIDACFRMTDDRVGDAPARGMFSQIKDRQCRFRPPAECVVQNTFVKIRQDERDGEAGHYVPTIAYREFVFFSGGLEIAIDATGWTTAEVQAVSHAAAHVNYFGKRGSFFQFIRSDVIEDLPPMFTFSPQDAVSAIPMGVYGVTQFLDDFGSDLCQAKDGFERISTYHDKGVTIGKHRILVSTLVPYIRKESSRSFTRYARPPLTPTGLDFNPPPDDDNT